jgi:hypothetical protein
LQARSRARLLAATARAHAFLLGKAGGSGVGIVFQLKHIGMAPSKAPRADANTQGFATAWAIFVDLLRPDAAASLRRAGDLWRFVEEKGARYFAGFAAWGHGAAMAMPGSQGAGLEETQSGARRFLGTGGRLYEPFVWLWMAEAHLLLDHVDDSFECLERSRQCIENRPEILRARDAPALRRVFPAPRREPASRGELERGAIEAARAQAGRSWKLRAATDLARLWRDEGKPAEARDLLAPLYARFPQGVETSGLTAARTLLEPLD